VLLEQSVITTASRPTSFTVTKAKQTALSLSARYVERNEKPINQLTREHRSPVVVVGKERIELYNEGNEHPFFFHPNAAMFRAKHWLKTNEDPLIKACQLKKGDTFFDGTLGLGSDAILASLAIGEKGKVIGCESSKLLAYLVQSGLKSYNSHHDQIDNAMRRIIVHHDHHLAWLKKQKSKSIDVVYFDPMFEEKVKGSAGFDAMRPMTVNHELTYDTIEEAKRVARKRVVLKDHFRSTRFDKFGFTVQVRPSATYHFGIIDHF